MPKGPGNSKSISKAIPKSISKAFPKRNKIGSISSKPILHSFSISSQIILNPIYIMNNEFNDDDDLEDDASEPEDKKGKPQLTPKEQQMVKGKIKTIFNLHFDVIERTKRNFTDPEHSKKWEAEKLRLGRSPFGKRYVLKPEMTFEEVALLGELLKVYVPNMTALAKVLISLGSETNDIIDDDKEVDLLKALGLNTQKQKGKSKGKN